MATPKQGSAVFKSGDRFQGVVITPELADALNRRNQAIDERNALSDIKADRFNQGGTAFKESRSAIAEANATVERTDKVIKDSSAQIEDMINALKGNSSKGVLAQTSAGQGSALVGGARERAVLSALV